MDLASPPPIVAPLPDTPDDFARRQRSAWIESLCAERERLELSGAEAAVVQLREALELEDRDWTAITWSEGIPASGLPAGALELLRAAVASGAVLVLALPAGRGGGEDGIDLGEASRIAAEVEGLLLAQYLAEGSLIVPAGERPEHPPARLETGAVADAGDARAWLVLANLQPERLDGATVALSLAPVHGAYLERLEQANAGLRRANQRLARGNLGRHDSSAASMAWRLKQAQDHASELNEQLEQMKDRLAMEVEIGIRNDEYFQAARAQLQSRPHQIAARAAIWHRRFRRLFGR